MWIYKIDTTNKNITPLNKFILAVEFDDGRKVMYDVGDYIKTLPTFHDI